MGHTIHAQPTLSHGGSPVRLFCPLFGTADNIIRKQLFCIDHCHLGNSLLIMCSQPCPPWVCTRGHIYSCILPGCVQGDICTVVSSLGVYKGTYVQLYPPWVCTRGHIYSCILPGCVQGDIQLYIECFTH